MVQVIVRVCGMELKRLPFEPKEWVQVSLETVDGAPMRLDARVLVPADAPNPFRLNQRLQLAVDEPAADPANPGDESGLLTTTLVACDGNHPPPACNWSDCWQLEPTPR
jgi:hypothetical protein